MILLQIQQALEQLYRFQSPISVVDFLVPTDGVREKIIIRESPHHFDLALLMGPPILEILKHQNPWKNLDRNNLDAFCIAVEGVSHLLYLARHAALEKRVTQLELEIQAEVDKYLLVSLLLREQKKPTAYLMNLLFDNFQLTPRLKREEQERYLMANHFAKKFCGFLERNFIRHKKWRTALAQARHFYHLNHWSKLRPIPA